MANFNPKAFCLDRVARRAGNRTYLKIKLDLKADQMAAWDAFAKASDDRRRQGHCALQRAAVGR